MPREPKPWFWKKRGQWVVNIGGRRHYLGPERKAAFEEFYQLMRQPADKPTVSPRSIPAILDAYLDWLKLNRSEATFRWYHDRLERFCRYLEAEYPGLRIENLKPYHVTRWACTYPNHKRTTRRNYLRSVKRALAWAAKEGYLDANPVENLEVPAAERREVVVSYEEYQRLLSFIPNEDLRDLFITTWETGCRPQESLIVEARHVDVKHQRWVFPPSEAKGERLPRIVYLTDDAMFITRRLMLKHPDGTLFRNGQGRPWTPDAVNCAVDRIAIRMGKEELKRRAKSVSEERIQAFIPTLKTTRVSRGRTIKKTPRELHFEAKTKLTNRLAASLVPRYCLYAIRHSWATHALQRGVDTTTVSLLMGHNGDPAMLAKVYQHLQHNPQYMLEQAKRAVLRA